MEKSSARRISIIWQKGFEKISNNLYKEFWILVWKITIMDEAAG